MSSDAQEYRASVNPHQGRMGETCTDIEKQVSLRAGDLVEVGVAACRLAGTDVRGEGTLLGGTAEQMDSLHPLMKSSDSHWPEGRKDRVTKKIQACGHVCMQRCADRGTAGQPR